MNTKQEQKHQEQIIDQFSRQAIPFTRVPGHLDSLRLLLEFSGVTTADQVLDVACGPGIVGCEFAGIADHVTGIDLTPAMIEQAEIRQRQNGLDNLTWITGNAEPLPFAAATFSLVITRYSFHHFIAPEKVLAEMCRVCRPDGCVMVADVAMPEEKSAAYDQLEIIRDPSHVHALTEKEFATMFQNSGLTDCRRIGYEVEIDLEAQLKASFPNPGVADKLRQMIVDDIGVNRLGINVQQTGSGIKYHCPITVYAGRKR